MLSGLMLFLFHIESNKCVVIKARVNVCDCVLSGVGDAAGNHQPASDDGYVYIFALKQ